MTNQLECSNNNISCSSIRFVGEGIHIFEVKMFGDFQMIHENGILNEESIHSDKLVKLLAYLLIHKERSLSVQELSENLWHENETDNPAGKVKNLIYRLRRLLNTVIGKEEFIMSERGAYRWNPMILVQTDLELFKQMCTKAKKEENIELVKKQYEEASRLYQGEFLGRYANESWMIPLSTYYHSMFLSAVKNLAHIYEEQENYEQVEQLCNNALNYDLLDEQIHCSLIYALMKQNKQYLAMEHYYKASKILCETLSIKKPVELQLIYDELINMTKGEVTDPIAIIEKDMAEQTEAEGAFFCGYAVFREIFRLELRRINRSSISEYVMLITISLKNEYQSKNEGVNKYILNKSMKQMEEVLIASLRKGDVASKYSDTQYIMLLPFSIYETALMVSERIIKNYNKTYDISKINIKREIEAIGTLKIVQMLVP